MIITARSIYRMIKAQEPQPGVEQPAPPGPNQPGQAAPGEDAGEELPEDNLPGTKPDDMTEEQPPSDGIKPGDIGDTETLVTNALAEYIKTNQKEVIQYIVAEIEKNVLELAEEKSFDQKTLDTPAWQAEVMKLIEDVKDQIDKGLVI